MHTIVDFKRELDTRIFRNSSAGNNFILGVILARKLMPL